MMIIWRFSTRPCPVDGGSIRQQAGVLYADVAAALSDNQSWRPPIAWTKREAFKHIYTHYLSKRTMYNLTEFFFHAKLCRQHWGKIQEFDNASWMILHLWEVFNVENC